MAPAQMGEASLPLLNCLRIGGYLRLDLWFVSDSHRGGRDRAWRRLMNAKRVSDLRLRVRSNREVTLKRNLAVSVHTNDQTSHGHVFGSQQKDFLLTL